MLTPEIKLSVHHDGLYVYKRCTTMMVSDPKTKNPPVPSSSPASSSTVVHISASARFASLVASHAGTYAVSALLAILGVALGFVPYVAVSVIVASLIAGNAHLESLLAWCAVAALAYVAKAVLAGIPTLVSHKATFAVVSEVRRSLAHKLNHVPLGYVLETPSGALKSAFVERADQLDVPLAHVILELTANLLVPIGIIVYLFVLDWRMGLASLITIPIGLVVYTVGMRDYPEKYGRIVATKEHMGSTIVEYINGIEVIKTLGQAASSYEKFTDAVRANSALMLDWMRVMLPSTTVLMNVVPAVLLGVLPIGCVLIMDGSLAPAKFVTIIVLSMEIIEPLFSAMMYTNDISKISTIMDELGSVLDQPEMQRPMQAAVVSNHTITLNDVTFSYHKTTVLKGTNMTIAEGQTVALVGPSGSGKSTIAKLIASQWDVGSGSVCIGAVDVREMPSSQVSDMISYVAQDNYLFDDTVMNNIRMGCPGASDAEVVACAQASGCHDFIMSLEQGYDTVVGVQVVIFQAANDSESPSRVP